ncbi:MAG: TIGR03960 family B12-binding radical SAM protein [Proteobacteria bacterium]|nr:TIGR03960 family B12-binding radical SAM protein [Pseudomonadota bacterium]MBU1596759.1 TIGR03960 family B12-binding radical SAM protein [Pseudomonadota bacterium]
MKELLPLLSRPSRYLGNEWGTVRKDPSTLQARVALAFPDMYEVGMSYLGQKILAQAVNERPRMQAERVYAPCVDTAAILREHGAPLATLETDTPLARMDAVAFSLTHELCYTNVLYMLDLAQIPLHAEERLGGDWPLIMAGGGACFDPEPLAGFMDLMVLGDGEVALPEILERAAAARAAGTPRAELLRQLTGIPGVYVPSLFAWDGPGKPVRPLLPGYARVEKALVPDIENAPFPTSPAVPFGQAIHDRFTLELARGCTRGCRFCHAGMVYRPVREKTPERLEAQLVEAVSATGFEEVSMLSLSTGDYSALETLFDTTFSRCAAEQVTISLPSLRVGSLSERIMGRMASIRRTGVTLAPEAGSQRLRDVINKGVSEEALVAHVRTLFEHGWQQVKLYFMIGLPTETDEDLDAIADLCVKVRDAAGRHVKRLQVTAAVSPFVPKTHTPFQWEGQIGMDEIRRRVYRIKDALRPYKRITLKYHQPEMSYLEGVFSRGDRRLGPVIESAYRKGALFSSWRDHLKLEPYMEALAEHGLTPEEYQAPRNPEAPLPWDHLDCGVSREFLLTERRRALAGSITEDCRYGACRNCGVCSMDGRKSRLTAQAAKTEIRPRMVFFKRDQEDGPDVRVEGYEAGQEPPAAPTGEAPDAAPKPDLSERQAQYRIWYEKLNEAAYLSQLELQSILERALRRTRFPLSFSAGFHPMPRISFGRALPVGVESRSEWFTLTLRENLAPQLVLSGLAAQMPHGLTPLRIEVMGVLERTKQAVREDFLVRYSGSAQDIARWQGQWAELMARESFVVERKSKNGPKPTDVRALVAEARPEGPDALRLTLDWANDYMSPVNLVRAVNAPITPLAAHLLKTGQEFAGG